MKAQPVFHSSATIIGPSQRLIALAGGDALYAARMSADVAIPGRFTAPHEHMSAILFGKRSAICGAPVPGLEAAAL